MSMPYLSALFDHWLFSFGAVATLVIAMFEKWKDKTVPARWFFGVAVALLAIAQYQAWDDERHEVEKVTTERRAAESERDFWKGQSYAKDETIRQRDGLLGQNYAALVGEQTTSNKTQQSLAQLSTKVLEVNKREKFDGGHYFGAGDFLMIDGRVKTIIIGLTNVPIGSGQLAMQCSAEFEKAGVKGAIPTAITTGPNLVMQDKHTIYLNIEAWSPTNPLIISVEHKDNGEIYPCTFKLQ